MVPEAAVKLGFKEVDKPSKIVVLGDGDFIRNDSTKKGEYFNLGYDRFMRTTFANKDFILNALSYLLDEKGVILAKNKTIALRPLDKPRIASEKLYWQLLNVGGPIVLLVGFGLIRLFLRNRKYSLN
ncbi:MAG TPA: gliding motility-associated ABC transporter substrate-binding protein GldG, partial [Catalimonadaceae bacterium]|nr:gliding motility-associated ABC transporter substrate-binding protein GldG [Catalimonadaceae bacterium]